MNEELELKVFKNFMRGVHQLLNTKDTPVIEINVKLASGKTLVFTPGNDYRPPEDKAED